MEIFEKLFIFKSHSGFFFQLNAKCIFEPGMMVASTEVSAFFSRSDITIVCKGMQFSRFPLDEHKCLFKLSSCEYF